MVSISVSHLPAYSKKTLDDRSFSRVAPKLWNNLPFEIRCSSSIVSSQSRHFYLRKLFIDTLLFLCIYLYVYLLYILIWYILLFCHDQLIRA